MNSQTWAIIVTERTLVLNVVEFSVSRDGGEEAVRSGMSVVLTESASAGPGLVL